MALQLSFNTEEIASLNNDIKSSSEIVNSLLSRIEENCSKLDGSIDSNEIDVLLKIVTEKINTIKESFNTNINILTEYLKGQLMGYENLVEEAVTMLNEALEFINQNFKNS